MGKKAPSQPDPAATAAAQGAANRDAAVAQANINMVNQYTPYGSLEYSQRGTASDGTPQYSATQTLSPEQQALFDLTTGASKKYGTIANTQLDALGSRLSNPLDFGSLGAAPVANENTRQSVLTSILDRADPQFDRDRAALETRLANQGIGIGSAAYNQAMDELNRSRNDYRLAADAQAGSEMARMFGLESAQRQRAVDEMVQQRSQPLNELAALLTGSQVQGPSYVNTPQQSIAAPDIAGMTFANAGAQNQQNLANTKGFYDLLGAGLGAGAFAFSDRRLKRDIEAIGSLANGLPVYRFKYVWGDDEFVGLMADEVRMVHPEAVVSVAGFGAVDYSQAVL